MPVDETVEEFAPPTRGKPPLLNAPRADNAPVEGQEVRTQKAGGFDDAAREINLDEIRRLLEERDAKEKTQIGKPPTMEDTIIGKPDPDKGGDKGK
jgi:hypothetical protein